MHVPTTTSVTLLSRAVGGDREAWNRLVEIYGPIIRSQCRRRVGNDEDADDLTQTVFLAIAQRLPAFRRDKPDDSFLHWLRAITSRKIVDWLRDHENHLRAAGGSSAQAKFDMVPEQIEAEWSADELTAQAFQQAVRVMKSDFEETTWQAFWLSAVEGLTTAEICERLNIKPGSVRQARFRIRQRLIEEMGDAFDFGAIAAS